MLIDYRALMPGQVDSRDITHGTFLPEFLPVPSCAISTSDTTQSNPRRNQMDSELFGLRDTGCDGISVILS